MALRIKTAGNKILAIDWDARTIRLVLVRTKRDGLEVVKAASVPVAEDVVVDDPKSFGAFLRRVVDQAGVGVKHAVLGIPREKVVLNTLSVPPTSDNDLPALVAFQITKELPFGPDEATLDFATRSGDANSPRDVLVAAVRNDVMSYYRQTADAAGIKLDRISLRPYANMMSMTLGVADAEAQSFLLVDVGPEMTEIDIATEGRLVFSRAASVRMPTQTADQGTRIDDSRIFGRPVKDMPSDPMMLGALDDLLLEVMRTYEAYRAIAPGMKVQRILVAGATGIEAGFAQLLSDRLGVPAELFNPGPALDLPPPRARELRGFSAALGLAMGHAQSGVSQIDFLSPKRTATRAEKQRKLGVPIGLAAALLVVAMFLIRDQALGGLQADVAKIKKENFRLKTIDEEREVLEKQVKVLEKWLAGGREWSDDIMRITAVFPGSRDMYVMQAQMSETMLANLQIRTRDSAVGPALVQRIRELGMYNAKLEGTTEVAMPDGFKFTERLLISLRPDFKPASRPVKEQPSAPVEPEQTEPQEPDDHEADDSPPAASQPAHLPTAKPMVPPQPATAPVRAATPPNGAANGDSRFPKAPLPPPAGNPAATRPTTPWRPGPSDAARDEAQRKIRETMNHRSMMQPASRPVVPPTGPNPVLPPTAAPFHGTKLAEPHAPEPGAGKPPPVKPKGADSASDEAPQSVEPMQSDEKGGGR